MIDWIYSTATWLWGGLMVVGVTAFACGCLLAVNRPFRGEFSVPTDAYENVRADMAAIVIPHQF